MMYAGLRIKTPHSEFIKKIKYDNSDTIYSFFYNYFIKNKETNKYEVAEAYVVNVTNIMPKPDSEIICTKIIKCQPKVMKSQDGRDFLNCVVYIEADNVSESKLPRYEEQSQQNQYQNNNNNYNNQQQKEKDNLEVGEDDLPF